MERKKPKYLASPFECPYCGIASMQRWEKFEPKSYILRFRNDKELDLRIARCENCSESSIWKDEKIIFPITGGMPPSEDMPELVKELYEEARAIVNLSPKASAVLLRRALERLAIYLGAEGETLFDKITDLETKGLNQKTINLAHKIRIIGNEGGAHEGWLDLDTESDENEKLFWLINKIIETTITDEKEIKKLDQTTKKRMKT